MPDSSLDPTPRAACLPWDRARLARFLHENEAAIRGLAREKLFAATKRVFGSEDIVNSVAARLLTLVDQGRIRPRNEGEAWEFIKVVVAHKTVDKNRLMSQLRHRRDEAPEAVEALADAVAAIRTDDEVTLLLHRSLATLTGQDERALFNLWLRGASHAVLAGTFGITETTSRRRISDSLARLRLALAGMADG